MSSCSCSTFWFLATISLLSVSTVWLRLLISVWMEIREATQKMQTARMAS